MLNIYEFLIKTNATLKAQRYTVYRDKTREHEVFIKVEDEQTINNICDKLKIDDRRRNFILKALNTAKKCDGSLLMAPYKGSIDQIVVLYKLENMYDNIGEITLKDFSDEYWAKQNWN